MNSGSSSFNSKFEVTPMREPIQKTKDSMLSVDAPEFVPRVTQTTPQLFHRNQHQILNRNTNHNHGPHNQYSFRAPNNQHYHLASNVQNQNQHGFHAHQPQQTHRQINNLDHQLGTLHISQEAPLTSISRRTSSDHQLEAEQFEPSEAAMIALQFLVNTITKLMNDPGQFESYQKELTTLYIDHADNQHVISNAIELFFNHSIEEQNFRYTGARLCRLLDSIDPTQNSLFRRLICYKLQYNDSELIQYMNDNETHKVRNTTLFLAELYIQLQNDGSRITNIATSIHHSIGLLMLKTSPENIKCVCQTLKLCGYELDIDFPKETEELMNQLCSCENTDVSTQRLLSSVIELRKNRWGRNNDNTVSNPPMQDQHSGREYSNDPVFYGPDGNVLTEEESAFLWNATSCPTDNPYEDDENDPDALVEIEPEMDLEIQLAFKDFVNSQNKK